MKKTYLSLGSNLGDREKNLITALEKLQERRLRVAKISSIYETEPQDVRGQPWFLNLVAEAETEMLPMMLLAHIGRVEKSMGRHRQAAKGPRVIDIDILLFGKFVIETAQLVVPHERMTERRFVLEPMVELAPELRHPVLGKSMRELLAEVKGQSVKRIAGTAILQPAPDASAP
jgi:2-amino-4-hydroxy-6-hydroxymethyldihydropteridine diphosphokinase